MLFIEGMLPSQLQSIISKNLIAKGIKTDAFQKPSRDDSIGINILTLDDESRARNPLNNTIRESKHQDAE
jgi:hypothetical protein